MLHFRSPAFLRHTVPSLLTVFLLGILSGGCFFTVTPDKPDTKIPECGRNDANYYGILPDDPYSCMRIHLPQKPVREPCPAVIIFPGGAYGVLALDKEGNDYAEFLNRHGIAGIVVKYPLGSVFGHFRRHPDMLNAAQRAIRLIRYYAPQLKIDPTRIGVMGSSAGGHLAGLTITADAAGKTGSSDPVDRIFARPDFAILCYPVVSMQEKCTHARSRDNLIGSSPSPELLSRLSVEKWIPADCPPVFLWQTLEDKTVDPENSRLLEAALKQKKIRHKAIFYSHGPHGMGLLNEKQAEQYPETAKWSSEMLEFLREIGVPAGNNEGKISNE